MSGARRGALVLLLIGGGLAHPGAVGAATGFSISVAPAETTLAQFTTMDVFVDGTDAGEQLTVTLQGVQVASGTSTTAGEGLYTFNSGDVPVPPGAAGCGTDAVNLIFAGDVVASTSVRVYCPTVNITPDPIDSAGGPAAFTVTGIGFPADRDVTFNLDGAQNSFDSSFTDANGAFSKPASRPALPCGAHRLVAYGQPPPVIQSARSSSASTVDAFPTLPASATFTVTGCRSGPLKLTANPAVVTDGTLTHVTGSGFVPGAPVTLAWQLPDGAALTACSPTADSAPPLSADATGAIDTFCFAPPHQILGVARIVATQTTTRATLHAAAPVVVEGGSMQPSSGDQLIFRH
ncbi:hypothetical protein KGA66_13270 [Actinocrinis puniceicyclus]|uniref:IPT/TIG domain-containing protein n=1 Tax=Actinocrinis puniceicyclus TaxID=977794 RepID=A0A8J7WKK3_9ACTN|nr:hypothetical protein [Actinocrinis puniceicyclus]MBS2964021.1 hypothetical protein [Actinocrinis puniceicyclus]